MSSPTPEPEEPSHKLKILLSYTFSNKESLSSSSKRKKTSSKKVEKKKEIDDFSIQATEQGYKDLLGQLLVECGATKYNAVEKKPYPIKWSITAAKTSSVDIESFPEYKKFVQSNIIVAHSRPKKLNVWLDIDQVKATHSKRNVSSSDEEESGSGSDDDEPNGKGKQQKIDKELARLRGLLEKKYQIAGTSAYEYTHPVTKEKYPLTMAMMDVWTQYLYNHLATLDSLPNHPSFDPTNRERSLFKGPSDKKSRRSHSSSISSASSDSQKHSTLGHVSAIVNSIASLAGNTNKASSPFITTPDTASSAATPSSPPHNSPTKLPRFLAYAQSVARIVITGVIMCCLHPATTSYDINVQ